MFGLGMMEILILLLVGAGLVTGAVLVVVVALVAQRNAPSVAGSPGAFPCPKCKAFVPSGKRSCPACGAMVG